MALGYSPIGCCVPGLGLETSDPLARALNSAISTRLDSTRLEPDRAGGWNDRRADQLISGAVGKRGAGCCAHGSWGYEKGQIPWSRRGRERSGPEESGAGDFRSPVQDCRRPDRTSANPPWSQVASRRASKTRRGRGDAAPDKATLRCVALRCAAVRGKSRGRASSSSWARIYLGGQGEPAG